MNEWFRSLTKSALAAIIITVGILFIVFSDPPRTVCDAQLEQYQNMTSGFLKADKKKSDNAQSQFRRLTDTCKMTNSTGGCFELFSMIRGVLKDLGTVSPECYPKIAGYSEFKSMVWDTLSLMAQMAWGSKPPASHLQRTGWFDSPDLSVYCSLKQTATNLYGENQWSEFTTRFFTSLPEASTLSREEAWTRMLFSINCTQYL